MITPLEIDNKEFKRGIRGYKEDEVDEFLDLVKVDYEKLYKENAELREMVERTNQQIERYKTIEDTLKNTLIVAQNAADDLRANANKKSELIIQEAEARASEIVLKAHQDVSKIKEEYDGVKKQIQIFRTRFKTLLQSQLDVVLNSCDELNEEE